MNKNKTLLIVTNTDHFFLSHRIHLATGAQKSGYSVHVAAPAGHCVSQIIQMGFYFHPISMGRKSMNPFREIISIWSLYRTIKKISPNVIHLFTIKPVIYGTLVARLAGVKKIIATITGLGYMFLRQNFKGLIFRYALGKCYSFIFNSKSVSVTFQNRDDYKLFLDNNWVKIDQAHLIKGTGVDTQLFLPSSQKLEVTTIVFPARFLIDKGILELFEACKILHKEKKLKFQLWLCGDVDDGNPSSINSEQLAEMEREPFLTNKGHVKDMAKVFKEAHIACLPSYREGIPLSLLEASSSGIPIVTTDVPGCRDVVAQDHNGFLVPAKSTQELVTALEKLIQSKELRLKFGENGRSLAQKEFSTDVVVSQNLRLYENQMSHAKKKINSLAS